MKCRKQLVLTGYRVQFVDLREPKPRTPQEQIHVADRQWLDAMGLLGLNVADFITSRYERGGYHVISVERIPQKRTAEINLLKAWQCAAPTATEETPATPDSEVCPE